MCQYVCVYIHIINYYSATKRSKILLFLTIWMDVGDIMLSQVRKRRILYDFTYMQNLKKKKLNEQTKQKQIHKYREETMAGRGDKGAKGKKVKGIKKYKLPVIK